MGEHASKASLDVDELERRRALEVQAKYLTEPIVAALAEVQASIDGLTVELHDHGKRLDGSLAELAAAVGEKS
ncbi:MAG: hypothetical protein ACYTG0_45170 [Planctomycetota bacterium]